MKQPTLQELIEYMKRYGPDSLLESANHLSIEDKEKLREAIKKHKKR